MTICIVCKKELPEGSKLPVCEYHKGVATERAKRVGAGALAIGGIIFVARDKIIPSAKDKALPIAKNTAKLIFRR